MYQLMYKPYVPVNSATLYTNVIIYSNFWLKQKLQLTMATSKLKSEDRQKKKIKLE